MGLSKYPCLSSGRGMWPGSFKRYVYLHFVSKAYIEKCLRGLYMAPSDNTTIVTNMVPRSEIVSEIQKEAITNSPTKDMNFLTTKGAFMCQFGYGNRIL